MNEFKLKQKVSIRATGVRGDVRGIWHEINGSTQYNVRYYDNNGRVTNVWYVAEELQSLPETVKEEKDHDDYDDDEDNV